MVGMGSYIVPFFLALLLHVSLLVLLMPHWFQQQDPYAKRPRHIEAQMIDLKALSNQKELQEQFKADEARKEAEAKRLEALKEAQQKEAKQKETERKQAEAERKRQVEEAAKAEKAAEAKRVEAEKKAAAEVQRQKKRLKRLKMRD